MPHLTPRGIAFARLPPNPRPRLLSLRAWTTEIGVSYTFARGAVRLVHDPLPAFQIGRRLMVDRAEGDAWLERRRFRPHEDLGKIVDEIVADLLKSTDEPK